MHAASRVREPSQRVWETSSKKSSPPDDLSDKSVAELAKSIRMNEGCGDSGLAIGKATSSHTGYGACSTRSALEACATAGEVRDGECSDHADTHEYCEICAKACLKCEQPLCDLIPTLRWFRFIEMLALRCRQVGYWISSAVGHGLARHFCIEMLCCCITGAGLPWSGHGRCP